jgi:hypothetical protein
MPTMSSCNSLVVVGFLSVLLCGVSCGGVTTSIDGGDDTGSPDVATMDSGADSAIDGDTDDAQDPCSPGTCRLTSDSSGPCLPPGGPVDREDSGTLSGCCECGSNGLCSSECVCASPDTPIATPTGDRAIASLSVGDLVLSIDQGHLAAVPIRQTHRSAVSNHRVIEVVLRDGTILRISAAHPTADGRSFGQLQEGDWLGGREVASTKVVPYAHDATYDILPDSDTGTYFAGGALIGSTLVRPKVEARPFVQACTLPSSTTALTSLRVSD